MSLLHNTVPKRIKKRDQTQGFELIKNSAAVSFKPFLFSPTPLSPRPVATAGVGVHRLPSDDPRDKDEPV